MVLIIVMVMIIAMFIVKVPAVISFIVIRAMTVIITVKLNCH